MLIAETTFWEEPGLMLALLANCLTLDPSILLVRHTLYVLEDKGKKIGFIAVKRHSSRILERGALYVYPEHRKKGYGRKLMLYTLKKHRRVYILCNKDDERLKQKQGFRLIERVPSPLAWRRDFYNTFVTLLTGKTIIVMKR